MGSWIWLKQGVGVGCIYIFVLCQLSHGEETNYDPNSILGKRPNYNCWGFSTQESVAIHARRCVEIPRLKARAILREFPTSTRNRTISRVSKSYQNFINRFIFLDNVAVTLQAEFPSSFLEK